MLKDILGRSGEVDSALDFEGEDRWGNARGERKQVGSIVG